ncbi:MAG: 2-oxoglutarate and iron-dependent oxygenase domain-containing protein [Alphaproteobacteria bacterium]|jgi:isopenicillin N synthase-like dioxygenase|nr:2-oxoglutarate and iron-dependent oxygenase domain-containing protein [Alphaproteobacteria bacterium]
MMLERGSASAPEVLDLPVIDLGAYLAGDEGATAAAAAALREALEQLGFVAVVNHGVPREKIAAVFSQARRFHELPLDDKLRVRFAESYAGYLPSAAYSIKTSTINENDRPDLNEAFFVEREAPPADADPAEAAGYECPNQWPEDLTGFRETVLDYYATVEAFAHRLLPLYALDLDPDYFGAAFRWPQASLRLSHYPPLRREANQFGIAPHTDASFLTVLATHGAPGLHIRTPEGEWRVAPEVADGFIVNSGDMLRRWSNDRLLSTQHMAVNDSAAERYAAAFFFSPNLDHEISCLPSCRGAGEAAKHPPVTYREYRRWFMDSNYRSGVDATETETPP